jgi:drug/metabolite transporter (DMT)-like permease
LEKLNPFSEQQRKNLAGTAYLALAAGVLCIGCSAIFVKLAALPGTASAFYRVFIAGLILVPWWSLAGRSRPSKKDGVLIFAGGIFFALDLFLWNSGLLLTSAATATLLANNAPLWVGLAALLLFHERLSVYYWIGLAIALTGMALIVGGHAWNHLTLNIGDLLAVGASVFYAAYLLTTQHARSRVDTLTFMTLSMVSGVGLLLAMNLLTGVSLWGYSHKTWLALLGLGLISQLGGWLSINYALGHLRAAPLSVGLLGQAVVTALLSMPLLDEYLNAHQIIGGVLVLGGIYLVNRRNQR